jgi:hypothetical protein
MAYENGQYVSNTHLMDEVINAVIVKYNLKSRTEAYPFVIGMATECVSTESFQQMLSALK